MNIRRPGLASFIPLCFFLSGAAGLLYEVVWMRLLGLLFGHTVYAVTTVLAAYMGGLALGSFVLGRWADRVRRPLRAYAFTEAGIGAFCLLTPLLFRAADAGYLSLHRALQPSAATATAVQFALSALLLVAPTMLMGATLPLLSRAVSERPELMAARVGTLYAVNTWGAVAGTAATGFLLLPAIGLKATVVLGVALNAIVAALALAVEARLARASVVAATAPAAAPPRAPVDDSRPEVAPSRLAFGVALGAIAVSGAASMAYEVAWTRALSLVLGSSVYAFSAMLTTFLAGLALGALVVSRALRRWKLGLGTFAAIECAVALVVVLLLPLFGRLPEVFLGLLARWGLDHRGALLAQFTASFLVMIVPTLLIGGTFPLAIAVAARRPRSVGRDVGIVYGANTVGTILGSAGAGFFLIPLAGIQNGVLVAAGANLLAGLAVLWALRRRGAALVATPAAIGLFALLAVALPRWDQKLMSSGVAVYAQQYIGKGGSATGLRDALADREVVFYDEGLNSTVAVLRMGDTLGLTVNGKLDGGNGVDSRTQLLLGHLPALLALDAKRTLVIGLGTGMTAGALAQHPVTQIDVAELEPAMIDAARFFSKENHGVLQDPRVRLITGDGRHVLAASTAPYDLIVSEPSNPWIAGVANLFTREIYERARANLSESGVFVQWLQGYCIFEREMRMVVNTFQGVFPHVTIWTLGKNNYLLVGALRETVVDAPGIARRLESSAGARADLDRLGLDAEDIPALFLLGEEDARRFAAGAPVNTDDLPLLEFAAPRALYAASAAEDNERLLRSYQRERWPRVAGLDTAALDAPAAVLARARRQWLTGRFGAARALLDRVRAEEIRTDALRGERARLLFVLGRVNDSAAELEALRRTSPKDASLARWATAAGAVRDRGIGITLLHQLVRVQGATPAETLEAFAKALLAVAMETGERALLPVAAEQLEAASAAAPPARAPFSSAALVYLELGDAASALRMAERAVALSPADAQARFVLGGAYELGRRPTDALRAYDEAARLAPGWAAPATRSAALRNGAGARPR